MLRRCLDPNRWITLRSFAEREGLNLDRVTFLAATGNLPPHEWVGECCLIDSHRLGDWRTVAQTDGLLPQARVAAGVGA